MARGLSGLRFGVRKFGSNFPVLPNDLLCLKLCMCQGLKLPYSSATKDQGNKKRSLHTITTSCSRWSRPSGICRKDSRHRTEGILLPPPSHKDQRKDHIGTGSREAAGESPASISYSRTPRAHQSTPLSSDDFVFDNHSEVKSPSRDLWTGSSREPSTSHPALASCTTR